ncbi:MAG: hypothetical protein QXT58_01805 [Archaeoglobaceae archaeon]
MKKFSPDDLPIDWSLIERYYVHGVPFSDGSVRLLTLKDMADLFNVDYEKLKEKAEMYGWEEKRKLAQKEFALSYALNVLEEEKVAPLNVAELGFKVCYWALLKVANEYSSDPKWAGKIRAIAEATKAFYDVYEKELERAKDDLAEEIVHEVDLNTITKIKHIVEEG